MKVRTGFVSNSSSSSFVIIGIDENEIQPSVLQQIQNDKKIHVENIYDPPTTIYGYLVSKYSSNEADEIGFADLCQLYEKFVTTYNVDKTKVKLYFGESTWS